MRGGENMQKSKITKMKLASALLLTTVLIPNIAYADEEIDESTETETVTESAEVQEAEETESTEETQETFNEEAGNGYK
jgi:hypothetical protein